VATVEVIANHSDGQRLHAAEITNWRACMGGAGFASYTYSLTVTGADRNITVPAFTAYVPNGTGSLTTVTYAGGTIAVTASHATLPRMDILKVNSSGTVAMRDGVATAETGNVREAPVPALSSNELLIAVVRSPAAQAFVQSTDVRGRGVQAVTPVSTFFDSERTAWRANRRLVATWAAGTTNLVGVGFGTTSTFDTITNISGEPIMQMAATGTSRILGASSGTAILSPSHSPRMMARVQIPAASANVTHWNLGFFGTGGPTATGAYLRVVTTGNVFFVTRQGGSETATDLGALSRTTILGFEIETADAGVTWVCRNQASTALATHTTNVPTAATGLNYGYDAVIATAGVTHGAASLVVEGTFA